MTDEKTDEVTDEVTDELEDALNNAIESVQAAAPAILDAGAVIAYLQGEDGGEVIRQLIEESNRPIFIHALNAVEVYYNFARIGTGTPSAFDATIGQAVITAMESDGIEVRGDLDRSIWEDVAQLKGIWRRVSLADCCGVALARRMSGDFYTTDRHELTALHAASVASIIFIR